MASKNRTNNLKVLESLLRARLRELSGRGGSPEIASWLMRGGPEIVKALQRVDEGCYGVCVDCGRDIPLTRLRARPEAARCIRCQSDHERRQESPPFQVLLAS
jgi:hypothetical protein